LTAFRFNSRLHWLSSYNTKCLHRVLPQAVTGELQKGVMFECFISQCQIVQDWICGWKNFQEVLPGQQSNRPDRLWEPKDPDRICNLHFVNSKQKQEICVLLDDIQTLKEKVQALTTENENLMTKLRKQLWFETITESEALLSFYTGLPKVATFNVSCKKVKRTKTKFQLQDELILTSVKLRHNMPVRDFAYRFGISSALTNQIFHAWLDTLYLPIRGLVLWPSPD